MSKEEEKSKKHSSNSSNAQQIKKANTFKTMNSQVKIGMNKNSILLSSQFTNQSVTPTGILRRNRTLNTNSEGFTHISAGFNKKSYYERAARESIFSTLDTE